jgi:hypothetical protein
VHNDVAPPIALDDAYVYYTSLNTTSSTSTVKLFKSPILGGPSVELATDTITAASSSDAYSDEPTGIALDDNWVYWTRSGAWHPSNPNGKVMKVAKSGGPLITLLKTEARPSGIIADTTTLYFLTSEGPKKVEKAGGGSTQLALASAGFGDGYPSGQIAQDATSIYWVRRAKDVGENIFSGELYRIAK